MARSASIVTAAVCALAGLLIGVTALTSRGIELRPERTRDLAEIAASRAAENQELGAQVQALRDEIAALSADDQSPVAQTDLEAIELASGLRSVTGSGVKVILTDAPLDVVAPDIDEDLLVVHQQDIQVVVNALWAGGADAITIQGQRVIATTAIKCVGNTVVLHGTPYAPPYEIVAIGDQGTLERSLDNDPGVQIYRQYAQAYDLGYEQSRVADAMLPAFTGAVGLHFAAPIKSER